MRQRFLFIARASRRSWSNQGARNVQNIFIARQYGSQTRPSETLTVPCKSHGSINLDVYYPADSTNRGRVILYLPPGPSYLPTTAAAFDEFSELASSDFPSSAPDGTIQRLQEKRSTAFSDHLSLHSGCTVIQINYRLSKQHLYPTPIHDVLAGFDHVARNFSVNDNQVGVCGELVGGSLALMLALTETRPDSARISCVVANEPIVDWLFPLSKLATSPPSNKKRKSLSKSKPEEQSPNAVLKDTEDKDPQALTLSNLQTLRDITFSPSKPATYFDPFASPIHFLRTSGATVPNKKGADDDFATLADLADLTVDDETLAATRPRSLNPESLQTSTINSDSEISASDEELANALDELDTPPFSSSRSSSSSSMISQLQSRGRTVRPRKTRLRYPPPGISLRIPQMRISAAQNSPLVSQLEEFVRLLQRAIVAGSPAAKDVKESTVTELAASFVQGKEVEGFEELKGIWAEAEMRLRLDVSRGNTLWNAAAEEEGEVDEMARAVGEEFRHLLP